MNTVNDNNEIRTAATAMQHSRELQSKVYEAYEGVLDEGNNLQEDKSETKQPRGY